MPGQCNDYELPDARFEINSNAQIGCALERGGPCLFFVSFSDSLQTVDGRNLATVRAVYPPTPPTFNIGAPPGPGPSKMKMKSVQDCFLPILNVGGKGGASKELQDRVHQPSEKKVPTR